MVTGKPLRRGFRSRLVTGVAQAAASASEGVGVGDADLGLGLTVRMDGGLAAHVCIWSAEPPHAMAPGVSAGEKADSPSPFVACR